MPFDPLAVQSPQLPLQRRSSSGDTDRRRRLVIELSDVSAGGVAQLRLRLLV
jgi:hypothetical protein